MNEIQPTKPDREIFFGFGGAGIEELVPNAQHIVIVDTLELGPAIDIVAAKSAFLFPWCDQRESPEDYAKKRRAILAKQNRDVVPSLSPKSLQSVKKGDRVVLPAAAVGPLIQRSLEIISQKSTLTVSSQDLLRRDEYSLALACFRNAAAVSAWLSERSGRVAVIAAGESHENGERRPALADYLGAGAIVAGLSGKFTQEAEAAKCAFVEAINTDLKKNIAASKAGAELIQAGFIDDFSLALELDISESVPLLDDDGAFFSF